MYGGRHKNTLEGASSANPSPSSPPPWPPVHIPFTSALATTNPLIVETATTTSPHHPSLSRHKHLQITVPT